MFGGQSTADAGAFNEAKHKREGGKFSSTGGGGAAKPATGASAYAAKHGSSPRGSREEGEGKREAEFAKRKE